MKELAHLRSLLGMEDLPRATHTGRCAGLFRAIPVIVAAIRLSQPQVTEEDAELFAKALQEQAQKHDFDPLTGVAIIRHESNFQPDAISKNREDYGLAQIRARYIGACRHTKDPLRSPTRACKQVKAQLLEPEENIRVMAELITQNRKFCKKKVGSAKFHRWLASYQGRNNARKKRWCHPGKGTWRVIETRKKLIRDLKRQKLIR